MNEKELFYSILENLKPEFLPKGKLKAVAKKENELKLSAISSVSASSPFSTLSRLVANKDIYIRKCLLNPCFHLLKKFTLMTSTRTFSGQPSKLTLC